MKNLELIAIVASIILLGAYVLYGLIRAQQTQRRKQSRVKGRESRVKSRESRGVCFFLGRIRPGTQPITPAVERPGTGLPIYEALGVSLNKRVND